MEEILALYYENNAKKLHGIVDKILFRFGGLSNKDMDDFYSLANEVFVDVMRRYDQSQSFDVFLYSCLTNKIKTEITRRNREKRKADRMSISIDTPIDHDGNLTIADLLTDDFSIEDVVFDKKEEEYSRKTLLYLNRLSNLQRSVLNLMADGYLQSEIREQLHISEKQYSDCYEAIHSYRNIVLLFK